MSIPILARNRGGLFAATSSGGGESYDEDADTYFTALEDEGASPTSEQKTAISDYFTALKAASNFTPVKALYLPIWADAAANALNAVNPGTYDLTWAGTVTHASGYVVSNGSTGYGYGNFYGPAGSPTFVTLLESSFSINSLAGATLNNKAACGWYSECEIQPRDGGGGGGPDAKFYIWKYNTFLAAASGGADGHFMMNSDTPSGVNTNKFNCYKGTSLLGSQENTTHHINSSTTQWFLLASAYGGASHNPQRIGVYQVNFAHAGRKLASESDFQSDTATLLAAI